MPVPVHLLVHQDPLPAAKWCCDCWWGEGGRGGRSKELALGLEMKAENCTAFVAAMVDVILNWSCHTAGR